MRENQTISLKLLAVSDSKQKLIGLYQLKFNMKDFTKHTRKTSTFEKCIDKQGSITFSACLSGVDESSKSMYGIDLHGIIREG